MIGNSGYLVIPLYFSLHIDYISHMNRMLVCLSLLLLAISAPSLADPAEVPASNEQLQLSFAPVVRQAAPAVVNIYTKRTVVEQNVSPFAADPFFQQFFGGQFGMHGVPQERVIRSLGSGVIVGAKGLVITNYHVIKDAQDITVVLHDRSEYAARIVLRDEQSDLALLQLQDLKNAVLTSLPLRNSDNLEVGDLVLAIGNPFGVGQTVTSGIISATARSAKGINDFGFFIQTDAAINPGNSGGALVDMQGRLAGVPSAIYTKSGGSNGIGFAIPANMVRVLLAADPAQGKLRKAWLGAQYQDVTSAIAESIGLGRNAGVLIDNVYASSPASKAGLKAGDVITELQGHRVDDMQALRFRIATEPVGQPLTMLIFREGREQSLQLTLDYPPNSPAPDERRLEGAHPLSGITVANLNPALAIERGFAPEIRGVMVSASENSMIKQGDVVLFINEAKVESTKQLEALLKTKRRDWNIKLLRAGQVLQLQVRQ